MKPARKIYLLSLFICFVPFNVKSQFIDKLVLGFGGGINFSFIGETDAISLYENLSGEPREEAYSDFYRNIGNQYFFHIDFNLNNKMVLSLKPGTYTYKFTRTTNIIFEDETVGQQTIFRLRYFSVPVEFKYIVTSNTFRPFVGISGNYGLLLKQSAGLDESIIITKITAAPIGGFYIDYNSFTINFTLGYDYGMHNITRRGERYAHDGAGLYSQSDIRLNDLFATVSVLFSLEKSKLSKTLECVFPKR